MSTENVRKVLGKFSGNETTTKVTVQLLRMFIRRNRSESREVVTTQTMPGLMKRLSKSAGDLSPCRKKTRSNSYEDPLEDQEASETARIDIREASVSRVISLG